MLNELNFSFLYKMIGGSILVHHGNPS